MTAPSSAPIAEAMNFSEIVGLVNEPNTPSGAHESIRQICTNIPMGRIGQILDVGSNTGFATIEFASLSTATVTGVDINQTSVDYARSAAAGHGLDNAVFEVGDILNLPFKDETFDMVYCNNVTSFIEDRTTAINEYKRVLKPGGFLAAIPIYYIKEPPASIATAVSEAIAAPVLVRDIHQWSQAFSDPRLQLYYQADFAYDALESSRIEAYADGVVAGERLAWMSENEIRAARDRLVHFYELFNENLKYCGFSVLVYRFDSPNGFPVLHTSHPRLT